jgi:hypothetical protein
MPRLTFHGLAPRSLRLIRPLCRLEDARITDGEAELAEYTGSFWRNPDGNFTAIEIEGAAAIVIEGASGSERMVQPQFDLRIAGNALWNGRHCIAMLTDAEWIDRSTGQPIAAIVLKD